MPSWPSNSMCFYWDVKLWYHLGQKTRFFSLSEAIKFPWWSLRALSLREYTSKSKSFQSSQIIFGRNLPPSVVSHAMLSNMWQTGAETGDVGKGYRARLCGLRIGCDMLFVRVMVELRVKDRGGQEGLTLLTLTEERPAGLRQKKDIN